MSVELDPSAYFVFIQLGNPYLRERLRDRALEAYENPSRQAFFDPDRKRMIEDQIRRISSQPLDAQFGCGSGLCGGVTERKTT